MRKKILIGSIFVLTLLLLMPSIPAIQQKTIEGRIHSNLVEQLDFRNINEMERLDQIKHQYLYALVVAILLFRDFRINILNEISYDVIEWRPIFPIIEINNKVLFARFLMLLFTTALFASICEEISNKYGWNWVIPLDWL